MRNGGDGPRHLYDRKYLTWMVVTSFLLTFAFGSLVWWLRGDSEGLFGSLWGPVALATGVAIGQIIATVLLRMQARR